MFDSEKWLSNMTRCSKCDQELPPDIEDDQPCPYCGHADGMEQMDELEGEPAGVSKIRIWAKRIAIAFVIVAILVSLYITWALQKSLEAIVQAVIG